MTVTSEQSTRPLAGIPLQMATPETAAKWVCQMAVGDLGPVDVHLANAYTIALADGDSDFRAVLTGAVANFPDGRPLEVLTKGTRLPLHQVRGPALFGDVMDIGRQWGLRHYLLGSTDETLSRLCAELESRYPGVEIVGSSSPPFRALTAAELTAQDEAIRESGADIVWVGLGTPKQDFEVQRLANSIPTLAIAVGAAFDFVAGTKREAPRWVRKLGLEWMFRLASEPRRLWRRYLFGNTAFLRAVQKSGDLA